MARDLSGALNIPMNSFDYESQNPEKIGLARVAKLILKGKIDASVQYVIANMEELYTSLILSLRLTFIEKLEDDALHNILKYITHTTGVILRAYDVSHINFEKNEKLTIKLEGKNGVVDVIVNDKLYSELGINHNYEIEATEKSSKVLFETSYMNPVILTDLVAKNRLKTDELYYNTSRGSEPNLCFGINYLTYLLESYTQCKLFDGTISLDEEREDKIITVSTSEVCKLIGNDIKKINIITILSNLGFKVQNTVEDKFGVTVPTYRHDIENIQDITEEIVRMMGINNIESKALELKESQRMNSTMHKYYAKKELRSRAVSAGFDESISYAFADKLLLAKYNFPLVNEELDIINPITSDFNTLRTTTLVNLLQAVERNVNYSKKRVALFEIGTIFNEKREEKEVLSLIYSGQAETEYVGNSGKPKQITFDIFVKKLSAIIGNFELRESNQDNLLINPYQSADIIINNEICGFLTKIHPNVSEDFDISDTFVAEIDFDALIPKHINAHTISNFQGVYKDLSLVIDKHLPYSHISNTIKLLELPLLSKFYAVDVYEDEKLGDEKSLTIRLFIQSLEQTLHDKDIDSTVNAILEKLNSEYGAKLR
ncbi:Phenylalanyl-tRNA synthetase beta chain [hydrothermal vent metagenome]|uniref:phenylalanine--tRNA ligase n=1 Tax=hydrothermal vent metagenome TaxID=652676 RepID=A0A1W1BHP9_9ZZZZ